MGKKRVVPLSNAAHSEINGDVDSSEELAPAELTQQEHSIMEAARAMEERAVDQATKEEVKKTFEDLARFFAGKASGSNYIRRTKTQFRERRLSNGLDMKVREKGDGDNGAFSERMKKLWGDVGAFRNGTGTSRYKPIDGMYMIIKPVVEEVKICDGPAPIDVFFKYSAYYKVHRICFSLVLLLGWSPLISPIVWMDITATDKIFFNSTNKSGLSPALKMFSRIVFTIFLAAWSFFLTNSTLQINPSMRRFQWDNMKWTIVATLGINSVYTIAAGTIFPHRVHLLYLYMRMVSLAFLVYSDSHVANQKLRCAPEHFGEDYGGSGNKGNLIRKMALVGLLFLLTDFFRHSLILYETPIVSVISLNVPNPITGNDLGITNEMIMTSTYYTGMIFAAKSLHAMSNTSQLKTTSNTKFIITSK